MYAGTLGTRRCSCLPRVRAFLLAAITKVLSDEILPSLDERPPVFATQEQFQWDESAKRLMERCRVDGGNLDEHPNVLLRRAASCWPHA